MVPVNARAHEFNKVTAALFADPAGDLCRQRLFERALHRRKFGVNLVRRKRPARRLECQKVLSFRGRVRILIFKGVIGYHVRLTNELKKR